MKFTNKVVLITGASSGIGAATAKEFAKLGASLSLTGRNLNNLNQVAAECEMLHPEKQYPLTVVGNITQEKDIENILSKTIEKYGQLDVLVNSAGALERGNVIDSSLEQFDRLMNINVRSVFYLIHLAVPYLIKTKGNIVNVSSIIGLKAFPGMLAYAVSKAALDQITRCVALEVASKTVRVNSVEPGVIKTNLHRRSGESEAEYAQFLENCKKIHPLGRNGEPEEVAKIILFLASDHASFVTGVTLPVDGGRHCA